MMTVKEVSKISKVSIRTLQYYDEIGLLHPSKRTESGYRLYDDADLTKLSEILLFRELEFPLEQIKQIMQSPNYDRHLALKQQIEMLKLRKKQLDKLIKLASQLNDSNIGGNIMDFSAFDKSKQEEYAKKAKETWGNTKEYKEFEEKQKGVTDEMQKQNANALMSIFAEFGEIKNEDPAGEKAQALAKKLQDCITKNYYTCSKQVLAGLGQMYNAGGEFTENIDKAGGAGTAAFASKTIEIYCK